MWINIAFPVMVGVGRLATQRSGIPCETAKLRADIATGYLFMRRKKSADRTGRARFR